MVDFQRRVYHTFANAGGGDRHSFRRAVNSLRVGYYSVSHDLFLLLMAHQLLENKNYPSGKVMQRAMKAR